MLGERLKSIKIFCCWMAIVLSLLSLGLSIGIHFMGSIILCLKVMEKPLVIMGMLLLLHTVMEMGASLCRVKFVFWICIILSHLFSLGVLCFMVFSILVTNRNVSRGVFGGDGYYSHYLLEKYAMNAQQIKNCLVDYETCQQIPTGKEADFYKHNLSHTQSSCCQPPTYCGLEYHNATYWTMPKAGGAVANNDCKIWNNVQTELCFKCQSCKTIFYDRIEKYWKLVSHFSVVVSLLVLGCFFPCYILTNWIKRRLKEHRRHKVYPV